MRSTRLATVAVTAGAALLGWSAVGVSAIGGQLSAAAPAPAPAPAQPQQQQQLPPDRHQHDDVDFERHHDRHPGV
jgi:hypothetical protein